MTTAGTAAAAVTAAVTRMIPRRLRLGGGVRPVAVAANGTIGSTDVRPTISGSITSSHRMRRRGISRIRMRPGPSWRFWRGYSGTFVEPGRRRLSDDDNCIPREMRSANLVADE